jgi:tetratricopeptide (TPR) repeat protein
LKNKLTKEAYEAAVQATVKLSPEQKATAVRQATTAAAEEATLQTAVLLRAKQDASYWLGLIAFQKGSYTSAIDYFAERTLAAMPDNGPWTTGAMYNLARCYEATGKAADAGKLYQAAPQSPGFYGNLLRAQWLRSLKKAGS